ncbi:tyrosine-type recombinase/integrase [Pseudovibrio sp. WM33]|uniref:tyrosine-type recombinase/integrase n=1 Tax=Pseudovibrio sp. WM33 TaxID=1735585 RepID=UPI0007AECB19|nr:tyrosine-type recombinase/integrase [Pseudovibrio sp. WM33]KZL26070.1 Phage integrase family protein [Pseudovibrio sp. WM33]
MGRSVGSGNPDYLTVKNGYWHFVRRVPDFFKRYDKRTFARSSTGIKVADDPKGAKAARVAARLNQDTEEYWQALVDGRASDARKRYEAARRRARSLGFDYVTADDLAARPLDELLSRLAVLRSPDKAPPASDVAAVLGGEPVPQVALQDLYIEYEKTQKTYLKDLSNDQKRRWKNAKVLALKSLVSLVGEKPIAELSRSDAIDYREWLQDRAAIGAIKIATANKQIGHINKMFRTVIRHFRLELASPFSELRLEGAKTEQRYPFDPGFVQSNLLATGALDGLNIEARCILYLMVETGVRLSEAANLTAETIFLDVEVPHIEIKPVGRVLKTEHTARTIPLVGVSLMAMKECSKGFPRYLDSSATLSSTVNKFLLQNKLRPDPEKHSAYSLRHTFEDRLTAVEIPEKIQAMLMGHQYQRPRYGHGPTLEHKREWLQRIAFKPPSRV